MEGEEQWLAKTKPSSAPSISVPKYTTTGACCPLVGALGYGGGSGSAGGGREVDLGTLRAAVLWSLLFRASLLGFGCDVERAVYKAFVQCRFDGRMVHSSEGNAG